MHRPRHLPTSPTAQRGAGLGVLPQGWWQRLSAQAALAWLVLALVAAPTLGRLHQVVHADALERVHTGQVPTQAQVGAAPAAVHAHGLLQLLLAGHTPVDCLLLDQLALGDALHSASLALPAAVPAQAPPSLHAGHHATQHAAPFQARGPPRA